MVVSYETQEFEYVRVSDQDQNEARQLDAMKHLNIPERNIIIEKQSGKNFNERPLYQALKLRLRAGDTLFVKELDRLGRNSEAIKEEWRELTQMGVYIVIVDMPILDTRQYKHGMDKVIANIVLELLAWTAQAEREKIIRRQREGIDSAHARGFQFGAPKKQYPEFESMYRMVKAGEVTAAEAQRKLNMKPNTYYRRVKELEG
jgi:DNA invertase Pin-like site-specific DNA recombinase